MGRKSRKTKSLCQNTIEHEPDPEDTKEQMIKITEHINDRSQNFIKTEDPTNLSYSQTGLYEVVMLDANDLIKEEFALEDPNAEEHNEEDEEEISYQLAGPPKMCSKCLEAFPIDNFSSHTCRDINADRFSCKICPRKFRYKSLLVKPRQTAKGREHTGTGFSETHSPQDQAQLRVKLLTHSKVEDISSKSGDAEARRNACASTTSVPLLPHCLLKRIAPGEAPEGSPC
ncbi:uncharacterized protein LOC6605518 isoform X2 [Drosophila sechellia]|uniref:uncharacterized protein LOC6605518 isoform X2 n=1 Tax=Drosophila sechellia TaxID=7238 RepID=UPI0013DDF526|nr:uncharacterized protein LOC6605518 isoform X2 [Drosophila sechellia]